MIYLIGVEHEVQSISVGGDETANHIKYRRCLEQAIRTHQPTVVAEEYSDDALGKYALLRQTPQEFFTRQIAAQWSVKHLLCDPDLKTKSALGYQGESTWWTHIFGLWTHQSSDLELLPAALEVVKDFPIRESYWLQQLHNVLGQDVVFICGDYHVDTFGKRLQDNGVPSQVVERQIGLSAGLIERTERIRAYIEHNSQHIEDVFQEILQLHSRKIPLVPFPDS